MARAHGFTIVEKLLKLVGLIGILGVLLAGFLLPYVGGAGLAAKAGADKFLNTDCTLTEEPVQQKTTLYANDGKTVIAQLFDQNRAVVPLKQVPKAVVNALISTEDRRFYQHHGVDVRGILRAAAATGNGSTQGASTLTEQYVKQVAYYQADTPAARQAAIDQNLNRKLSDAKCALEIEKKYSKDQILEKYLNIAFFGENSYGIQTAANTYFGVDVSKLTVPQAAMLVGLVKSPSSLDPYNDLRAARARRDLVITNMATEGYITDAVATKARATPITLAKQRAPSEGCADATKSITNVGFFCDYALDWLERTGGLVKNKIETGGLKIVTTIDPTMQNQVQASLWNDMPLAFYGDAKQDPTPSAAIMPGLDPTNGAVKYMATTRQYSRKPGKNNTVNPIFTLAAAGSGSTFKYLVAVAALKLGVKDSFGLTTSSSYTPKVCPVAPGDKPFHNAGSYNASQTLRSALVASSNTFFVGMEDQVFMCNLELIVNGAKDLGISNLGQADPKNPKKTLGQSIIDDKRATFTLGQEGVSPLDLTTAYAVAANDGISCPPSPIQSITGPDGKPVAFKREPCTRKMDPYTARMVTDIMVGDTNSSIGTATSAFYQWYNAGGSKIAGKTGTNNGTICTPIPGGYTCDDSGTNAALWFVGMTPNLVSATAIYNPDTPTKPLYDAPGHIGDASNAFGAVSAGLWAHALTPLIGSRVWTWPSPTAVPDALQIPTVSGLTPDDAKAKLAQAGYKPVVLPNQTCGSYYSEGLVAFAGPLYAQPGATITLCLSSGVAANSYVGYTPRPRSSSTPGFTTGGGGTGNGNNGNGNGNGPPTHR